MTFNMKTPEIIIIVVMIVLVAFLAISNYRHLKN